MVIVQDWSESWVNFIRVMVIRLHTLAIFNVQTENPSFIQLITLLVAICGIFIPHVVKNVVYLYHNVVYLYHNPLLWYTYTTIHFCGILIPQSQEARTHEILAVDWPLLVAGCRTSSAQLNCTRSSWLLYQVARCWVANIFSFKLLDFIARSKCARRPFVRATSKYFILISDLGSQPTHFYHKTQQPTFCGIFIPQCGMFIPHVV